MLKIYRVAVRQTSLLDHEMGYEEHLQTVCEAMHRDGGLCNI